MNRLPPALAASATPRILELLPEPPARVLELGFAGIHTEPLRLAGYDVTVVEPDPAYRERARQRAGDVHEEVPPETAFDAVVTVEGAEGPQAPVVIVVRQDGSVCRSTSSGPGPTSSGVTSSPT